MTRAENFRLGFIRAMRDIQDGKNDKPIGDIVEVSTDVFAFTTGYVAGLDHFNGVVDEFTRYAERIGVVKEYEGFNGQVDWVHPKY